MQSCGDSTRPVNSESPGAGSPLISPYIGQGTALFEVEEEDEDEGMCSSIDQTQASNVHLSID
jgi:hypothetical protein